MLRVNFSLSADRALRIINATKQRLYVLDVVSSDFISLGTNVVVAMDTGIEIRRVICIGALGKGRSSQIVACGAPVSLKEHPAGLLVWFKRFDRIPFASMTPANVAISDEHGWPASTDLLYRFHPEFYNDGGVSPCVMISYCLSF